MKAWYKNSDIVRLIEKARYLLDAYMKNCSCQKTLVRCEKCEQAFEIEWALTDSLIDSYKKGGVYENHTSNQKS